MKKASNSSPGELWPEYYQVIPKIILLTFCFVGSLRNDFRYNSVKLFINDDTHSSPIETHSNICMYGVI